MDARVYALTSGPPEMTGLSGRRGGLLRGIIPRIRVNCHPEASQLASTYGLSWSTWFQDLDKLAPIEDPSGFWAELLHKLGLGDVSEPCSRHGLAAGHLGLRCDPVGS